MELDIDLRDDTSLIKSGFFDSLALFNLATWIEKEIKNSVDLTSFDLPKKWDTIASILRFIEERRVKNSPKKRKTRRPIRQRTAKK